MLLFANTMTLSEVNPNRALWIRVGEKNYKTIPHLPRSRRREGQTAVRLEGTSETTYLANDTNCEVIGAKLKSGNNY